MALLLVSGTDPIESGTAGVFHRKLSIGQHRDFHRHVKKVKTHREILKIVQEKPEALAFIPYGYLKERNENHRVLSLLYKGQSLIPRLWPL